MSDFTAEEKISKAIIDLQKPQPFFAHLVMRMRIRKFTSEEEAAIESTNRAATACVDAFGRMQYKQEFVNSLKTEEVCGLLAHETMHVALAHLQRLGPRDQKLANIAMDVVVNMMVVKSGMKLPPDGIPVDQHSDESNFIINKTRVSIKKVSEKTWEEVYAEILQLLEDNNDLPRVNKMVTVGGKSIQQDEHNFDQTGDMTPEQKEEWKSALAEAAAYAKSRGNVPGGMERLIDALLKPKVNWQAMLRKYLRSHLQPVDWSYQRPNKKSYPSEVFLPIVRKESVEVEVIIDTSGSIGHEELKEFMSEVLSISKSSQHVQMSVSFADTAIRARYPVRNNTQASILALKPMGGGGTCMENALDEIKEKNRQVPVTIVLTDGEDVFKRAAKDYPFQVIWVVDNRNMSKQKMTERVKYGQVVMMN